MSNKDVVVNVSDLIDFNIKAIKSAAMLPSYLVRVEDPTTKGNERRYIALKKPIISSSHIEFTGFEIPITTSAKVKTKADALNYAQSKAVELEDLMISWQRVISIKNLSYNAQKYKKEVNKQ